MAQFEYEKFIKQQNITAPDLQNTLNLMKKEVDELI